MITGEIVKESPFGVKEKCAERVRQAIRTLRDVGIINILFSEFPHPELIRRSWDIVRLMILAKDFRKEDYSTILSCYHGTHRSPLSGRQARRVQTAHPRAGHRDGRIRSLPNPGNSVHGAKADPAAPDHRDLPQLPLSLHTECAEEHPTPQGGGTCDLAATRKEKRCASQHQGAEQRVVR